MFILASDIYFFHDEVYKIMIIKDKQYHMFEEKVKFLIVIICSHQSQEIGNICFATLLYYYRFPSSVSLKL